MGQQRIAKVAGDDLSKRPANRTRRKTGNTVLDATSTRRGEVERAKRRVNDNVNAQASQHLMDAPVNRSIYNGFNGEQFTASLARKNNCLLYTSGRCRRIERCRSRWSPYH